MGSLQNNFSWSKSRDEKFRECPRQYYFHHYGSWGGWERETAPPRVAQIYLLKNLKSRHMWVGEVVHHTVENSLKHYRQARELKSELFLNQITERMRREFLQSKKGLYRKDPKRNLGLFEHEYGLTVPDDRWIELHETARRCYTTFANILFPEKIKKIPVENWRLIETMQTFNFEGTTVYVKIDFAYETEEGFTIIDWKTGRSEDVDNQIQLECYGLFTREATRQPIDRITTVETNLNTGRETVYRMIEAKADFAKHYIRNSIAAMKKKLVDPATNTAREEDFPFTENEQTCRWCNFRKVCPKWA